MPSRRQQYISTLLLSFLLSALLYTLLLIRYQIVPFGGTSLLFSDLDTQYVEFIAEYRRVLLGEVSLFWSWHAGLGMNFIALTAYYLASPFNFLLILFPENQLPLAVSILTLLKISCAGAAFAVFQRQNEPPRSKLIPVFSACYALSAYAIGYAFNIMWLDALIWLPLLCSAVKRLIGSNNKGMGALTVLLAFSFLSQFYMAWMTGAFCALYFLAVSAIRKSSFRDFLKNAIRFGICTGIAAGLSAFMLLPTFFVLKNNMGLIGQDFPSFTGRFFPTKILPKLFIGSFDGIKDCLPHIYCGLPALIGVTLYFTRKQIPTREKIVSGLVLFLLLLSFWLAPLDFVWHAMDHPSWFPYRYAFIFCFWILTLACKGFSEETRKKEFIAFAVPALILAAAFVGPDKPGTRFLLLNGGFLAAYAAADLIFRQNIRTVLLILLTSAELLLNGSLIMSPFSNSYTKTDSFQAFHDHYRALTEAVKPAGNDFFRMEKGEYRNYNDPLGIGYPGVSHFSSTASTRQAEFLKRLGFNCYATWCTYEGSTSASDALLGIRYELGPGGKQDSLRVGEETLEHPSLLPLFFFAEDEYARYDFYSSADALTRQNDLLKLLTVGDPEDYFESVPVKILHTENLKITEDDYFVKVDPSQPAFFEVEIEPVPGRSLYLFVPGASLSHTITIGTTELMNGHRDYAPFPICLDPFTSGEAVRVRIEAIADRVNGTVEARALDTQKLAVLTETVNSSAPHMERNGDTSFKLTTEASGKDRLVVSSIPFDAGWQVQINGRKQPLKMIHESVLGFVLPAGEDEALITYRPYGMKAGLILSGTALLLWISVIYLEKRSGSKAG